MTSSFEATTAVSGKGTFSVLSGGVSLPVVTGHGPVTPSALRDLRAPAPGAGVDGVVAAEPPITRDELDVACREAYEAGLAAGRDELETRLGLGERDLRNALEEIERFRAGLVERTQRDLVDLAVAVARKIVQGQLVERPEVWLGMIREAVQESVDRELVRIRAGVALHRFLAENLSALKASLDGIRSLELIEDAGLPATGCVVESALGEVDLGVETQVEAIRIALAEGS